MDQQWNSSILKIPQADDKQIAFNYKHSTRLELELNGKIHQP